MSEEKDGKHPEAISDSEAEKVSGGIVVDDGVYNCSKCGRSFSTASVRDAHQIACTGGNTLPVR